MSRVSYPLLNLLLVILVSSCSYGQTSDELEGMWEPVPRKPAYGMPPSIKSLEIKRVGKREISYFVFRDDHGPKSYKRIGNTLIHVYEKKDTSTIHFDPTRQTLSFDKKNIVGFPDNPVLSKTKTPGSTQSIRNANRTFFDFDLYRHQSGVPNNAIPKIDWIPFRINKPFVVAKTIKKLEIPVYKSFKDTVNSTLSYQVTFEFDEQGNVTNLTRPYGRVSLHWDFTYRSDAEQSLEKILFHAGAGDERPIEFNYDTDSWLVDESGQKVTTSRLDWTLNKAGLPAKLIINRFYGEFIEFTYDASNNLVQAAYTLGKSKTTYYFKYTDEGVLKKVNIVE